MTNKEALEGMCERCIVHDVCGGTGCEPKKILENLIEKNKDYIGEKCYRVRMVAENIWYGDGSRKKYYYYLVNTIPQFERYRKFDNIDHWEIVEGLVTKTNREQVGKAVFLTSAECESFLIKNGIDYKLNAEEKE